ncbi:MAG: glycosyltransferase family 9 protein [Bacteroidota bacterium]|nr:glycosyltransferase family 9 protein [Bacteroidota bacterium]MDP4247701.1 glycosyltransferase family 9 protein [Bacteroidota bacterium]MDP4255397.1 glycosyltransferase family 9 protein [Bacteroidota bacterium]MDP4257749.1 glycosyltransferase family 9 protein [Bacteroidota bacterium]
MQKFLVIQTAFIGDVVLATGIIEKLHASFPDAKIDFLLRKGNESLLLGHPFINELLVWDKRSGKLINLWRLLRRIRKTRYDKVINVQRFAATGFLTAFSGAGERIGFDKNPLSRMFSRRVPHIVGDGRHEIERNQDLIRHFTDDLPARPRLYPSITDEEKAHSFLTGSPTYITISPASVWFTKQYPKEKWIDFLARLPDRLASRLPDRPASHLPASCTVFLLGAPTDRPLCEEIITGAGNPSHIINLAGKLTFLQSAALQKGALMNYVNDSAPMHFASAVNAPVTAIYCSTIPAFGFGPLSDRRHIVELQQPLDCRPCGLHGYRACPKGHFKCARLITDDQLLATLDSRC